MSNRGVHFSLTLRVNALILWALVLLACVRADAYPPADWLLAFAIAGLIAGWAQVMALGASRPTFMTTHTARELRSKLGRSLWGKVFMVVMGLVSAVLLATLLHGGEHAALPSLIGSYAAFAVARELAARSACYVNARKGWGAGQVK